MITLYVSILSYKRSKQECKSARKRMNIIQRQKRDPDPDALLGIMLEYFWL